MICSGHAIAFEIRRSNRFSDGTTQQSTSFWDSHAAFPTWWLIGTGQSARRRCAGTLGRLFPQFGPLMAFPKKGGAFGTLEQPRSAVRNISTEVKPPGRPHETKGDRERYRNNRGNDGITSLDGIERLGRQKHLEKEPNGVGFQGG
jgi:hypothetical protein